MTKLEFIKKYTTYDQDMKNQYLMGYKNAYDKMTEVQKAQLRTAENGMVVTSQDAIDKMITYAVKDALYKESQMFKAHVQQYKDIIQCNVDESWLPEDIPRGQGYADAYRIFEQVFKDMV